MRNIAIIGTGSIATEHIKSCLQFSDRCRIVALCDIDPEHTAARAREFGLTDARLFTDFHDMLEDPELSIDVVSIAAPPLIHCEAAVAALDHGCHVLTEKPMAPSVEECDRMIAAAKRNNRILSSMAQNRYDDNYSTVKDVVASGRIGKPLFMMVESLWWRGSEYYDMWWRGTWEQETGGVTLNVGIHQLDFLLWVMGMPSEVTATAGNVNHANSEVEDVSMAMLRFPSGAMGNFTCTNIHHGEVRTALVQCEKAGVWAPWNVRVSKAGPGGFPLRDEDAEKELDDYAKSLPQHPYPSLFTCQIGNFLDALDGTAELRSNDVDGRNAIELISAIYKSAFTGQTVALPLASDDPFYRRAGLLEQAPRFNDKGEAKAK